MPGVQHTLLQVPLNPKEVATDFADFTDDLKNNLICVNLCNLRLISRIPGVLLLWRRVVLNEFSLNLNEE